MKDARPLVCDYTRALTDFSLRARIASMLQQILCSRNSRAEVCACENAGLIGTCSIFCVLAGN
jgi:hypothetical protein